jgi:hypothetical protein
MQIGPSMYDLITFSLRKHKCDYLVDDPAGDGYEYPFVFQNFQNLFSL